MTNSKLLQYLIYSIIVHIIIIALVVQVKKKDIKTKPKTQVLKSYLVVAPVKKKATQPPSPIKQEQVTSSESTAPEQESQSEQSVQLDTEPDKPQIVSSPPAQPSIERKDTQSSATVVAKPNSVKSPYASARNYLDQFNQQQIGELSKQGFSDLTRAKPLNPNKGPRTTQQIIDERSEAFAGRGSGIKVVGQFANGDQMIRLHGNCVRITDDPVTGGQSWQASNACGKRDEFNGQLQKSLNKYLKK